VSYTEFYNLVTDPDPGRPDFGKRGITDSKVFGELHFVGISHHPWEKIILFRWMLGLKVEIKRNANDAAARAKEIASREVKKKMLVEFVEDNNVSSAEVYTISAF